MDNKVKTYLYILAVLSLSNVTGNSPESKEALEEFESVHQIADFESAEKFPDNLTEEVKDEIPRPIESRDGLDSTKESREQVESTKQLDDLTETYYDEMFHPKHDDSTQKIDGLDKPSEFIKDSVESRNIKDTHFKMDANLMSTQNEGIEHTTNIESIREGLQHEEELSHINYDIHHDSQSMDYRDLRDSLDSKEGSGDYDYLLEHVESGQVSKHRGDFRPSHLESRAMGGNFNVMIFNRPRAGQRKKPQVAGGAKQNKTMAAGGATTPGKRKQQRRFQYIQVQNSGRQTNIRVQMPNWRRKGPNKGGKGGKSTPAMGAATTTKAPSATETAKLPNVEGATEPIV